MWDKARTRELFVHYHEHGDEESRDELITMYLNLVKYLASRFRNRGEPIDDLIQVGTIGLIKAIDRFDIGREVEFTTYATPTIVGELKRYFRDKGWAIRVPRRLQELRMQIASALPAVWADYEKISWVISQLVDNALKFTPQGGRVSVSTNPEGDGRVWVAVRDTGIGIPEDRLAEIFEAFHQLDGSATRRYGGTGLGLALVQKIVEAHQTGVQVTSEVGKGSCFQFSLPVFVPPRVQSAAD
mgnify:CR=1 FL=1